MKTNFEIKKKTARAIIINEKSVLLVERDALRRELREELAAELIDANLLFEFSTEGFQHFFFLTQVTFSDAAASGEEYTDEWRRNNGSFRPVWVEMESLDSVDTSPPFLFDIVKLAMRGK